MPANLAPVPTTVVVHMVAGPDADAVVVGGGLGGLGCW